MEIKLDKNRIIIYLLSGIYYSDYSSPDKARLIYQKMSKDANLDESCLALFGKFVKFK
jgi:hypothetical protein